MRTVLTLAKSASLYVPSTINGTQPAPPELRANVMRLVMGRMIDLNGGCTVSDATGGYRANDGTIITETVTIVRSNSTDVDETAMFELAEIVCRMMSQESVAVEINGTLHLIGLGAMAAAA